MTLYCLYPTKNSTRRDKDIRLVHSEKKINGNTFIQSIDLGSHHDGIDYAGDSSICESMIEDSLKKGAIEITKDVDLAVLKYCILVGGNFDKACSHFNGEKQPRIIQLKRKLSEEI